MSLFRLPSETLSHALTFLQCPHSQRFKDRLVGKDVKCFSVTCKAAERIAKDRFRFEIKILWRRIRDDLQVMHFDLGFYRYQVGLLQRKIPEPGRIDRVQKFVNWAVKDVFRWVLVTPDIEDEVQVRAAKYLYQFAPNALEVPSGILANRPDLLDFYLDLGLPIPCEILSHLRDIPTLEKLYLMRPNLFEEAFKKELCLAHQGALEGEMDYLRWLYRRCPDFFLLLNEVEQTFLFLCNEETVRWAYAQEGLRPLFFLVEPENGCPLPMYFLAEGEFGTLQFLYGQERLQPLFHARDHLGQNIGFCMFYTEFFSLTVDWVERHIPRKILRMPNVDGNTLAHAAYDSLQVPAVGYIWDHHPEMVDRRNHFGYLPIHSMVNESVLDSVDVHGILDILEWHFSSDDLQVRCYLDKKTTWGNTIAHLGNFDVLLWIHARPCLRYLFSEKNSLGKTPLHLCTERRDIHARQFFWRHYRSLFFERDHKGNTPMQLLDII